MVKHTIKTGWENTWKSGQLLSWSALTHLDLFTRPAKGHNFPESEGSAPAYQGEPDFLHQGESGEGGDVDCCAGSEKWAPLGVHVILIPKVA